MSYAKARQKILRAVTGILLFASVSAAQVTGLCNTGQTAATTPGAPAFW